MDQRSTYQGDPEAYVFDAFRFEPATRLLTRDGHAVAITDKASLVLLELLRARGQVVSKAELMQRVWPDTSVEGNVLFVNLNTLRKALGDSGSEPRLIQTLPKRGYRVAVPVRVVGPAGSRASEPFAGRQRELSVLEAALHSTNAGLGRVVWIEGVAGAGKTELCRALLARGRVLRIRSATGACFAQHATSEAYLPLLRALNQLFDGDDGAQLAESVGRVAPGLRPLFPAAFPLPFPSERQAPERRLRDLLAAFEVVARERSLLLVVEDVHWADASSLDLLRQLGSVAESAPICVVMTVRTGEAWPPSLAELRRELVAKRHLITLELGPLAIGEIDEYLRVRFAPNDFPPELASSLARASGGHPLFLARYADMLLERGDLVEAASGFSLTRSALELELGAPAGVRELIERRFAALDAEQRRALAYASVLGESFDSRVLAGLLGWAVAELEERLIELGRPYRLVELVAEDEYPNGVTTTRYRFGHALFVDALYRTLVAHRRIELHARVVELLSELHGGSRLPSAELARHCRLAQRFERAVELAFAASDAVFERHGAVPESVSLVDEAFELIPRLAPGAREAFSYLLAWKRGSLRRSREQHADAARDFTAMREAARSIAVLGADERERALEVVARFLPRNSWFGRADAGVAGLELEAYYQLGLAYLVAGEPARVIGVGTEMLSLARQTDDTERRAEALSLLGSAHLALGDRTRAQAADDECLVLARRVEHRRALLHALGSRTLALYQDGDDESARRHGEEARAVLLSLPEDAYSPTHLLVLLARIYARQGRTDLAWPALEEARGRASRSAQAEVLRQIALVEAEFKNH